MQSSQEQILLNSAALLCHDPCINISTCCAVQASPAEQDDKDHINLLIHPMLQAGVPVQAASMGLKAPGIFWGLLQPSLHFEPSQYWASQHDGQLNNRALYALPARILPCYIARGLERYPISALQEMYAATITSKLMYRSPAIFASYNLRAQGLSET